MSFFRSVWIAVALRAKPPSWCLCHPQGEISPRTDAVEMIRIWFPVLVRAGREGTRRKTSEAAVPRTANPASRLQCFMESPAPEASLGLSSVGANGSGHYSTLGRVGPWTPSLPPRSPRNSKSSRRLKNWSRPRRSALASRSRNEEETMLEFHRRRRVTLGCEASATGPWVRAPAAVRPSERGQIQFFSSLLWQELGKRLETRRALSPLLVSDVR